MVISNEIQGGTGSGSAPGASDGRSAYMDDDDQLADHSDAELDADRDSHDEFDEAKIESLEKDALADGDFADGDFSEDIDNTVTDVHSDRVPVPARAARARIPKQQAEKEKAIRRALERRREQKQLEADLSDELDLFEFDD